jgi:hypothetical protein
MAARNAKKEPLIFAASCVFFVATSSRAFHAPSQAAKKPDAALRVPPSRLTPHAFASGFVSQFTSRSDSWVSG